MSLKSSEVKNSSRIIRAVLISSFGTSSCCQTSFPTTIRPKKILEKLIPKIKLDSPELNCSVVFSLYCLRVSKKIDYFLRNLVRRERRFSWFNFNPLSFIGKVLGNSTVSLFCGFAFAFDLAATTLTLDCDACSSGRSARTSVLL